jgi:hypothetical protein
VWYIATYLKVVARLTMHPDDPCHGVFPPGLMDPLSPATQKKTPIIIIVHQFGSKICLELILCVLTPSAGIQGWECMGDNMFQALLQMYWYSNLSIPCGVSHTGKRTSPIYYRRVGVGGEIARAERARLGRSHRVLDWAQGNVHATLGEFVTCNELSLWGAAVCADFPHLTGA